jgi:orotate phosphoribosyltransferase
MPEYHGAMPHGERIAEYLLTIGAVKLSPEKPFTWTSGIQSPIYCDNRMIYSHPDARDFVVAALSSRIKNLHIPADVIAGTATAAIGWAALVADRLKLPFVYVRSEAKAHGAKKRIEGDLKPGKHVIVVEDLISTAKSSASTVEALRTEGQCTVTDVAAIFSYELASGLEKAGELKVRLHPLTTLSTLLDVALSHDRITEEQAESIAAFSRDPEDWGKKMGF